MIFFLSLKKLSIPIRLRPFGYWWLDLSNMVGLPATPIPAPAGVARLTLRIPVQTALLSMQISVQAIVFDPRSPFAGRFTNVRSDLITR